MSVVAKLYERVVTDRLTAYLEKESKWQKNKVDSDKVEVVEIKYE